MIASVDGATSTGMIDFNEFLEVLLVKMSERDTKEDAMRAFRQFDLDHQGRISFTNLQVRHTALRDAMTRLISPSKPLALSLPPSSHLPLTFLVWQAVARELGETMTDEEIGEMISAADLDKDGFINEEEFLRILKKGVAGA